MKHFLKLLVPFAMVAFALVACAGGTQYKTTRYKLYSPVPSSQKITVYKLFERAPKNVDVIGTVDYEGGSSCSYADMEAIFVQEARSLGGEGVRITFVREPDDTTPCYRGSAEVVRVSEHVLRQAYEDSLKVADEEKIKEQKKQEAAKKMAKNPVLVAIVETVANGAIKFNEAQYLTDILREEAVKILRSDMNYTIMTRENILAVLPADKSIEDGEGDNLIETGRNISAQYIAQAKIGAVGEELTISVEIYSTVDGKLLSSFNVKKPSFDQLEKEIREKSPKMFKDVLKIEMEK